MFMACTISLLFVAGMLDIAISMRLVYSPLDAYVRCELHEICYVNGVSTNETAQNGIDVSFFCVGQLLGLYYSLLSYFIKL